MSNLKFAVGGIVESDSGILLVKAKPSQTLAKLGKVEWHIPVGLAENSESPDWAIIREISEQTNQRINVVSGFAVKVFKNWNQTPEGVVNFETILVHWYLCKVLSKREFVLASSLEEASFVPKAQLMAVCSSESISTWPQELVEYIAGSEIN